MFDLFTNGSQADQMTLNDYDKASNFDHSIQIESVSVTYSNGHKALDDVTLNLSGNKIFGLAGTNGAGKSTLFNALMGFVKPDSGSMTISGLSVTQALKSSLISYVPQSESIDWNFPLLVEDVVMMGRYGGMGFMRRAKPADHEATAKALGRVGLLDMRKRQIGELSGGQKRRMFVARALAQGSPIFLMDEPFAGVDMTTEQTLIDLLKSLAGEGHMIVVSTHNLNTIPSFCDDVVLINRKVIGHGPVETTYTRENLTKAFGGPGLFEALERSDEIFGNTTSPSLQAIKSEQSARPKTSGDRAPKSETDTHD